MTGDPYAIVVDPGRRQRPATRRQQGDRDRRQPGDDAMARGRRASSPPTPSSASSGSRTRARSGAGAPPSRRQAWAVIKERGPDGVTFPVASVHYLTDKRLGCTKGARCQRQVNKLKVFWTEQVSELAALGLAGDSFDRAIIGGDFNATRKDRPSAAVIRLGYRKAIRGRIDYIFNRGAARPERHRRLTPHAAGAPTRSATRTTASSGRRWAEPALRRRASTGSPIGSQRIASRTIGGSRWPARCSIASRPCLKCFQPS